MSSICETESECKQFGGLEAWSNRANGHSDLEEPFNMFPEATVVKYSSTGF